jgi:hypothetical protein
MSNKFRFIVCEILKQIIGGVLITVGFLTLILSFAIVITRCAEADTPKSVITDEVQGRNWILGTIDDEPLVLYRYTSPSGGTTVIGVAGDSAVIIEGNSYHYYLENYPNDRLIYPNILPDFSETDRAVLHPED